MKRMRPSKQLDPVWPLLGGGATPPTGCIGKPSRTGMGSPKFPIPRMLVRQVRIRASHEQTHHQFRRTDCLHKKRLA